MKNIEKVIACLKELGFKPLVANFEDRLKIQKIVLLNLQDWGRSMGLCNRKVQLSQKRFRKLLA